jgi:L,D-transpeptidase catalytic domain
MLAAIDAVGCAQRDEHARVGRADSASVESTLATGAPPAVQIAVRADSGGTPSAESIAVASTDSLPPLDEPPSYHAYAITGPGPWLRYAKRLGPERLMLILKVNRVDANFVQRGDTLAVPDALGDTSNVTTDPTEELAFSPLPRAIAGLDSVPKLFAVSRRVQAFGAYERGRLVRWGPTSTGSKDSPTPDGLFDTNWKARETISTEDSTWVLQWCVNFHGRRGLSIHQFALPGYPASHACVRLLEADAVWFYDWVDQWILAPDGLTALARGTPILIFGDYAFGKRRPWKRLIEDPSAASVSIAEIDSALVLRLPALNERAAVRATVVRSRAGT